MIRRKSGEPRDEQLKIERVFKEGDGERVPVPRNHAYVYLYFPLTKLRKAGLYSYGSRRDPWRQLVEYIRIVKILIKYVIKNYFILIKGIKKISL